MTDRLHSGVWLSDIPLDACEGASGQVLLEVILDLTEPDLTDFEWVEGKPYREWLVPAGIISPHMRVRVVPDEEADMLDPRFSFPPNTI
jgi:hypothetical protein